MIRKVSLVAAAVALAATLALAQGGEKTTVKLTGYVIDNMCAEVHGTEEDAQKHPNACALMPACEKSGFALISGGKSYKLDEQGNKLAADAVRAAKTQKGLKVEVEGTVEGSTLHATRLEAVKEASK